jgi:uncharacterized protein
MDHPPRVAAIDVLRGFSLLGILVMNIQSFAMPSMAYLNPTLYGSLAGVEGVAWSVGRLFFDLKFLTLFSMLFGASLLLGGEATRPRRRLAWLLGFGLAHAYLVWYGDILFTYAVVGLLLLGARGRSIRWQGTAGLALVLVVPLASVLAGASFEQLPGWLLSELRAQDPSKIAAEVAAFRGDWVAQFRARAPVAFTLQTALFVLETGWRTAGCMLLGMVALRRGVFEGALGFSPWGWWSGGVGLGLTGAGLALQWTSRFDASTALFCHALHELGSLFLAGAITLAVVELARRFPSALVVQTAGRLGRVAFSAYLMQSLVGTLVFGGHGLGQFGHWSRLSLLLAPFAFWAFQAALAWWWTARFRTGPLEALWRGLSRGDFSLGDARPRPPSTLPC